MSNSWVYTRTGASVTYTAGWYNNYPRNYAGDFGSADCAGLFSRQHFLDLDIDWGEQQYILDGLTADTDFKLADLSCLVYQKTSNTYAPYNKATDSNIESIDGIEQT